MTTGSSPIYQSVTEQLARDPLIGRYYDTSLPIPKIFRGSGRIRLIILGQDPTVKRVEARASIKMVLNLDKAGSLKVYLAKICRLLGIDMECEVYATNLYKNFFIQEPTQILQIEHVDLFHACLKYWLPVLQEELLQFPDVPVITLGEPLLSTIVCNGATGKVRDYWGYRSTWKQGDQGEYQILEATQTLLNQIVFPFPHQPSWQRKKFYSDRLAQYCHFIQPLIPK